MIDRYRGAAEGWAAHASAVYGPLAADLVAAAPQSLTDRTVLDAGAGTGLVSVELARAGARPVALDLSLDMLRWRRAERPPALVGELTRVPLRTGAVDAAVAAFVLNHLPDPAAGLRELRRVTRAGGAVLAMVYANSFASPQRDRVDEIAMAHGYRYPDWYRTLRQEWAPRTGTTEAMAAVADTAGLHVLEAVEYRAEVGLDRPEDLVDYRLGQAHCREWLAGLSSAERAAVRADAIAAVAPIMEPYRPGVVRLVARG